jgi:flagellar assembly protein FliH
MSAQRTSQKRFLFERSFDDPRKLYLPNEKRKSELAADRKAAEAMAAAEAAEAERRAAQQSVAEPAAPPPPPPEEMFTQSQLEAAREEGFVAGHTAALEEAETARSHYVADALNLIAQGLNTLDEQQKVSNREIAETTIRLLFAIAKKTIPATAHEYAKENITDFVRKTLPLVIGEPKLLIRAHAMIVDDLRPALDEVFRRAGFQGTHVVVADYELQPGDARMEWNGGGAERSETRIWRDIERMVAETVGEFDENAANAALAAEDQAEHTTDHNASQDGDAQPSEMSTENQEES